MPRANRNRCSAACLKTRKSKQARWIQISTKRFCRPECAWQYVILNTYDPVLPSVHGCYEVTQKLCWLLEFLFEFLATVAVRDFVATTVEFSHFSLAIAFNFFSGALYSRGLNIMKLNTQSILCWCYIIFNLNEIASELHAELRHTTST